MPHHTLTLGFTSQLASQVLKTVLYFVSDWVSSLLLSGMDFRLGWLKDNLFTDLNQQDTMNSQKRKALNKRLTRMNEHKD